MSQGQVLEVNIQPDGDELAADHLVASTTLTLMDVTSFSEDGGQLQTNGVLYTYDVVDFTLGTVHITTGLATALGEGEKVLTYPLVNEKWAMVEVQDNDDVILARIPHNLYDKMTDGIRDPQDQEAVEVQIDDQGEWVIVDIVSSIPSVDGSFLDPTTTIPPAALTDHLAPSSSPDPLVTGGIGILSIKWGAITNADPVGYRIHLSTEQGRAAVPATAVGDTNATVAAIRQMAKNLISYPSFESNVGTAPDGWAPTNCTITVSDEVLPFSGKAVLKMVATSTAAPKANTATGLLGMPVVATRTYRVVTRLQSALVAGKTGSADVTWYDAAGAPLSTTAGPSVAIPVGSYVESGWDALAPAGVAFAAVTTGLNVTTTAAADVYYADLIEFRDPTQTQPLMPMTRYYARIVAHDADGDAPQSNEASDLLYQVTGPDVAAEYIYAGNIVADQITGGTFASEISLSGKFKTADAGQRVEIDPTGINLFRSDGGSTITLPTDENQGATFSGSITAAALTLLDGLEIRGQNNSIVRGSKLILQTQITGSATPPGVVVDYPTVDQPALANIYESPTGIHYTDGGDLLITTRFFETGGITFNTTHWNFPIKTGSDGVNRADFNPAGGLAYIYDSTLTKWYVVMTGYNYNNVRQIRKYDISLMTTTVAPTLVATITAPAQENIYLAPRVARSGTSNAEFTYTELLYNRTVKIRRYDKTLTLLSTITTTATPINDYSAPCGTVYGRAVDLGLHASDTQNVYIVGVNVGDAADHPNTNVYVWNSTGSARLTDYEFMLNGRASIFGIRDNGTSDTFTGFISQIWATSALTLYTDVAWTTEGANWFTGYAWYDTVSTVRESNVSILQRFTMKKHARFTVTTPPYPDPVAGAGTAPADDDVNSVQIYLGRNTTTTPPARTALWRQTSPAVGATKGTYTLGVFSGTNPPASSNFPSTGSAFLESSAINPTTMLPKFQLTGDGYAHFENLDVSGGGSAYIEKLVLNSVTDAATTAGNAPALRVGNLAATHLRIDNNEIVAMSGDATQGNLFLNLGGGTKIGGGDFLSALAFGNAGPNTDASSQVSFNHGLGTTPLSVQITARNSLQYQVFSVGSTQVTLTCRTAAGVLTGTGVATNFWFMAAA
jgi:hypothetical protein